MSFKSKAPKAPLKANVELINDFMINDFMEYGIPLNQAFVIHAVRTIAEALVKDKKALKAAMKDHPINPEAWIACAEAWLKQNP